MKACVGDLLHRQTFGWSDQITPTSIQMMHPIIDDIVVVLEVHTSWMLLQSTTLNTFEEMQIDFQYGSCIMERGFQHQKFLTKYELISRPNLTTPAFQL